MAKNQLDPSVKNVISNDSFTIYDSDVRDHFDYFTLTYENRTLNLDTIVAARDQVLTGVRFRVHSGSVHLEARFTYFDEATGKLDLTTGSEWKMNFNTNRTIISKEHTNIPTRLNIEPQAQSKPLGTDDTNAVRFVPTSWTHDMAQTTVPFFDSNLIEPPELAPLSGVGLFYKAKLGYGGFVAPRLITHDYATAAMRIRGAVGVYGV